jgi:hypothetical protein
MGRLNRRVTERDQGCAKPAIFLEPDSSLPYEKEELQIARDWLQALEPNPISQADLASTFEKIFQDSEVSPVESAWIDGGPFSRPAPLREAGVTIAVIRAEDETACVDKSGRLVTKEASRYAIPMTLGPVAKEIANWKRLGFVFIAPAGRINYSKEWGAQWVKN